MIAVASLRCVVVIDEALPPGLAANAVGVLALTLGATLPDLVGAELLDADGDRHPGLIPHGLPVLAAPSSQLSTLRDQARAAELGVIDFPTNGQQTTDYDEFRRQITQLPASTIKYLGVIIYGPRRAVSKLTGRLPLLR
jgi:hypothetical protein